MKRLLVASLVVVLASAGLWSGVGGAEPVLVPRTLASARPAGVGVVEPGFRIDLVAATWATGSSSAHHHDHPEVRFRRDGRWERWTPMGEDGAQAPGQFGTGLVPGRDADAYQVRGVPADARVVAINTTDGPLEVVGTRARGSAHAAAACRSRADWGADESSMTWAPTWSPVQVLTVHHTDTSNSDLDPAATVRAIYRFHAVDRGWGDIGYQVLVDQQGVRYEGRRGEPSRSCLSGGGDGSEFGHRADGAGVAAAHVANMNSGNFGIALLGTYTSVAPPAAQRSALEDVLAGLAQRHRLDPQRLDTRYVNPVSGATRTVATISGHRDWLATDCPGGALYAALPEVRRAAAARVSAAAATTTTSTSSAPTMSTTTTSTTTTSTTTASTTTTSTTTTAPTSSTSTTAAPALTLTAALTKARNGQVQAELRWAGTTASTVDVWRNGSVLLRGTANDGVQVDPLPKGAGTYRYRVCAGATCSPEASVTVSR